MLGREFDENLMRRIFELCYENDTLDLPYSPDVSDYLMSEVQVCTFGLLCIIEIAVHNSNYGE